MQFTEKANSHPPAGEQQRGAAVFCLLELRRLNLVPENISKIEFNHLCQNFLLPRLHAFRPLKPLKLEEKCPLSPIKAMNLYGGIKEEEMCRLGDEEAGFPFLKDP